MLPPTRSNVVSGVREVELLVDVEEEDDFPTSFGLTVVELVEEDRSVAMTAAPNRPNNVASADTTISAIAGVRTISLARLRRLSAESSLRVGRSGSLRRTGSIARTGCGGGT